MKINNKKIIIGVAVLVFGLGIGLYIKKSTNSPYELATVERGKITAEVLATGRVASPTSIDLRFKTGGTLESLAAKAGKKVAAGEILAKLKTGELDAKLAQAEAAVSEFQAKFNSLVRGAPKAEIVVSATSLTNAEKGLNDAIADAYAKAGAAVTATDILFTNAKSPNPTLKITSDSDSYKRDTEWARVVVNGILNTWSDSTAQKTLSADIASQNIGTIQSFVSKLSYLVNRLTTSGSGLLQSDIDSYISAVNTAQSGISAANTELSAAMQTVKAAQAGLNLAKSSAEDPEIKAAQAALDQAHAAKAAVEQEVLDAKLVAPVSGIITSTAGKIGESVDPSMTVVSLISNEPFEVDVNVSEDSVAGVAVGESANFTLDAYPDIQWTGKVFEVDPAGTIINGSVYYKTKVSFDKPDERLRAGMTANVWIKTGSADSTLMVPASAIQKNGLSNFVQIYKSRKITNQNVTTGLKSQTGMIEILSGLSEGHQVVIGSK